MESVTETGIQWRRPLISGIQTGRVDWKIGAAEPRVQEADAIWAKTIRTDLPEGRLAAREREVLALVTDGYGCQAIAHRYGVAFRTVKAH